MLDRATQNSSVYAVLTGDLIRSSKYKPDEVDRTLARIGDWEAWHAGPFAWPMDDARFTRSRGDGWQMLDYPAHEALRRAIILKARERNTPGAIPTRIAIGIGTVEHFGTSDLSDAAGEAFVNSGRCLEVMHADETLLILGSESPRVAASDPNTEVTKVEKDLVGLINWIISRWTAEQAEATAIYLHPDDPTLAQIAAFLQISPQAVGYRIRGAGAPAIREALKGLEWEWQRRWQT